MSKIKNVGLDQYGIEPFKQQQFGTAGVEGVKMMPCQRLQCDLFPRCVKVGSALPQTIVQLTAAFKL